MIYNENDIARLRSRAKELTLEAPEQFWNMETAELAAVCNGVGPEAWPKRVRKILTKLSGDYEVCAVVHDVQHEYQSAACKVCAKIFLKNAMKIWSKKHGAKAVYSCTAWAELAAVLAASGALYFFGEKYWPQQEES